jgi:hypothetical protein
MTSPKRLYALYLMCKVLARPTCSIKEKPLHRCLIGWTRPAAVSANPPQQLGAVRLAIYLQKLRLKSLKLSTRKLQAAEDDLMIAKQEVESFNSRNLTVLKDARA